MFNLSKVVHEVLTFDEDFQTVFKTSILIAMQISTFKIEIPSQIVKTFSQICIFDEKKNWTALYNVPFGFVKNFGIDPKFEGRVDKVRIR